MGSCVPDQGGIVRSFACKLNDITSVTITSGVISTFTMVSVGLWEEFLYDLDNTANWQAVSTTAESGRTTIEQTAFMKFKGISETTLAAANTAKDCCDTVWIHVLANGTRVIQGFERLSATGAPERTQNRSTRIVPTANTDTGSNQARTEYTVAGNANSFPNTTTLTDSAILAL